jgi:hypothetical protein
MESSSPRGPEGAAAPRARPSPRVRIEDLALTIRTTSASGVRIEVRPPRHVTASVEVALPVFEGWLGTPPAVGSSGPRSAPAAAPLCSPSEIVLVARGVAESAFTATVTFDGAPVGRAVAATLTQPHGDGPTQRFDLEIAIPLHSISAHVRSLPPAGHPHPGAAGAKPKKAEASKPEAPMMLGLALAGGGASRTVELCPLSLLLVADPGPLVVAVDLVENTDALLFGGPERRIFDLQNPEEGIWRGTGRWHLRLFAQWLGQEPTGHSLEPKPMGVQLEVRAEGDAIDARLAQAFSEDPARRTGAAGRSHAEIHFDASHPSLDAIPSEGRDVRLEVAALHAVTFVAGTASLPAVVAWRTSLPIRVRDPAPLLPAFQRLSAVGIDFGTSASVAALIQKGYRSLLRLGTSREAAGASVAAALSGLAGPATSASSAENPTYLLIEDNEALWAEMARVASEGRRFPALVRVVRGSHVARDALAESPSAVVGELKTLPERVIGLDQSPLFRDRERQRDFLLDEPRVRALVRTYGYLLGRAINRPGQDVYLHYWLTHPAELDARASALLEEEVRRGLLLSIPEGIPESAVQVSVSATEPEAFAAEVCPELAAHPALEPLLAKFGELRFCVFDFGGGTLDIACGRFRPATEDEQIASGCSTVIETLQVTGDDHLGGETLTHELAWLVHQHDKHLPEMLAKEIPMMRPPTVPANHLVDKPHLYKRSLAGRQNRFRFDRALGLERVKFGPHEAPRAAGALRAARLDGSEVTLESTTSDPGGLHAQLRGHLEARVREGVKLMRSVLRMAPWSGATSGPAAGGAPGAGARGDFAELEEQGVVLLLAGNSSRSAFVERALAEELDAPDLKVWSPGGAEPFRHVVRWDMPERVERGARIVGVTPKTAVALGALKIASKEVHLVRRTQGFSYFLGDLRGFPPKFHALVPMGTPIGDPNVVDGPHWIAVGRWNSTMPLRLSKELEVGKMTSSDPRIVLVPTGLPPGLVGTLSVCVSSPEAVVLRLEVPGSESLSAEVPLAKFMR